MSWSRQDFRGSTTEWWQREQDGSWCRAASCLGRPCRGPSCFSKSLWENDIESFASSTVDFVWSKQTYFGGLYQKTIARRR